MSYYTFSKETFLFPLEPPHYAEIEIRYTFKTYFSAMLYVVLRLLHDASPPIELASTQTLQIFQAPF